MIPFLSAGDTIGLAATARKISLEEITPALKIFESWGLEVKLSSTLFEAQNQFGGTDEQRAKGFQELLDDPNIKAIICARGGYGTVRMIDLLDFTGFKQSPKWIIGFSDITVLHSHIHTLTGLPTIHGPMLLNMQPERADEESLYQLRKLLTGEQPSYYSGTHTLNKKGKCKGKLVGGNLSVLYSTLGSVSDIDTSGKILFLEDLDEYLYHIDRMMMNLKRNGKLDKLAGLVVGDMSDMNDNTIPFGKTAEEIILEHTSGYHFPVCFGFPAGHEKKNLPLMMGAGYTLEVAENSVSLALNK